MNHNDFCNCEQALYYFKVLEALVKGQMEGDLEAMRQVSAEARAIVAEMHAFDEAWAGENDADDDTFEDADNETQEEGDN